MFKKAITRGIKRVVRGALWRTRAYVHRLDDPDEDHNFNQDDWVYPWLNSLFVRLLTEAPDVLRLSYTWGVLHGVHLAKALGINRVSVIEFGVAGGNGLVSLDRAAEKVEGILGVGIDVYGFDTGVGLPKPKDYRDLPNLYTESSFRMDVEALKKRLTRAQLVLGLVGDTVPRFIDADPAPVAFVSFDLDYYSSTMDAFKLLEAQQALLLPRIHCYFDDIMGFTFSDYNGERLAMSDFNGSHPMRKISPIHGLSQFLPPRARGMWAEKFYMAHIFDHQLYGHPDGLVRPRHRHSTALTVNESNASEVGKGRNIRRDAAPLPEFPAVRPQEHDANDPLITRTIGGRIKFWNSRAEELYGWKKEEVLGRVSHDLLQTQFPKPLEEIEADLVRNGRWEGKLVHTSRDGRRTVVESRWTLHLTHDSGAVVEINRRSTDGQFHRTERPAPRTDVM